MEAEEQAGLRSVREIAERLSAAFDDVPGWRFSPDRILSRSRGSPRAARLRWMAMRMWVHQTEPRQTYAAAAPHFRRDPSVISWAIRQLGPAELNGAGYQKALWPGHPDAHG